MFQYSEGRFIMQIVFDILGFLEKDKKIENLRELSLNFKGIKRKINRKKWGVGQKKH